MLPIITDDVECEKLSIYNASVLAKNPLNGARIKNTTGKNLLQGPITVLEGNGYAGDARIPDLQPKETRLISYAVDLATEVQAEAKEPNDDLVAVKITKGILEELGGSISLVNLPEGGAEARITLALY